MASIQDEALEAMRYGAWAELAPGTIPGVEAVSIMRREVIIAGGRVLPIVALLDAWGDETPRPRDAEFLRAWDGSNGCTIRVGWLLPQRMAS